MHDHAADSRVARKAVLLSRRQFMTSTAGAAVLGCVHADTGAAAGPEQPFVKDTASTGVQPYANVHGGQGTLQIKFFQAFRAGSEPSLLLVYTIPPGASEGVHTHRLGDSVAGSFDEFYYILEGEGEMAIDGETVPVAAGDHVFTPNGVAHGIANTSADRELKVFLTAIRR